jgi:lipopolysaccharide transport system permease protein
MRLSPHTTHSLRLLWQFTLRGIETRYKGSLLGPLWIVLSPLLMLSLYVFIFGYVFNGRFGVLPDETRTDYALALFLGLNMIQFFSEVLANAPRAILGSPNLVKKVVFPLPVLPCAQVGIALFGHMISTVLLLLGVLFLGHGLSWYLLLWPVVLLPVVLMGLGLAFVLSSVGAYMRDISQMTGFLTLILMYTSAVFYPISKIHDTFIWSFLKFNPLLHAIELSRHAVVWGLPPNWLALITLYAIGVLALLGGWIVFKKLRIGFADVL